MKKLLSPIIAVLIIASLPLLSFGQTPNWSEDIATIIYNNCSKCHHSENIAPFVLMSYSDAYDNAYAIQAAVNSSSMPPWPPDQSYTHFAQERVLTDDQIQLINDWVNGGAPQGDPGLAPTPPVFVDGPQIINPDLTAQIETYTVGSNVDEYRCFVIPSGLAEDKFIEAIEAIPGNRSIVHHVLIFYDTTGQCVADDEADPLPGYACGGGSCDESRLVGSWVPGSQPQVYPAGLGVPIQANGWFILQVHYSPGSMGQTDSTEVIIKFTPTNLVRPVFINAPLEHTVTLTNGPLIIEPNSMASFHSQFEVNPIDVSVVSVGPHMHLRGSFIEAFGVDPANVEDTIKFIRIPEWDFHWQGQYMFQKLVKVPAGTMLHANATYDNTSDNPDNPDPDAWVFVGAGTNDEMLLVYFAYTYYLPGDENIILDSAILSAKDIDAITQTYFNIYPNPADDEVTVYLNTENPTKSSLRLYDVQGRLIKEYWNDRSLNSWSTESVDVSDVAPGLYFLSLEVDGKRTARKLSVY